MSQQLEIYALARPGRVLDEELGSSGYTGDRGGYTLEGQGWLVSFYPGEEVELEDLPDLVKEQLPGAAYFVLVSLEGEAPRARRASASRAARVVAKACGGLVYDPQEETTFPKRAGLPRVPRGNPEEDGLLYLGWWFENDIAFWRSGYRRFYETLERLAPQGAESTV